MAMEHGSAQDIDLERTDRLPILDGADLARDFNEDSVRMEPFSVPLNTEFVRPSAIDLPSLAESVRSVEERIARQTADYEALNRSLQQARESEAAATQRLSALEVDIAGLRGALDAEKTKTREQEKALNDKNAAMDAARTRAEQALVESTRHQGESKTLRDTLSAREATIAQSLHSLGERDAQLAALKEEHGKILPTLEAREKSASRLESELSTTRSQLAAASADLKATRENAQELAVEVKRHEAVIEATRLDLGAIKTQSSTYLELLRSRDWRAGFDQNQFLELDARAGAADKNRDQRDKFEAKLLEQNAAVEKLQTAANAQANAFLEQAKALKQRDAAHTTLSAKLITMEEQCARLTTDLAARETALNEARFAASADAQRLRDMIAATEKGKSEHASQLKQLQADHTLALTALKTDAAAQLRDATAVTEKNKSEHASQLAQLKTDHQAVLTNMKAEAASQEQGMTVLMAHLKEARRPIDAIEAEVVRLKEQLGAKAVQIETLTEDHKKLTGILERTKGALEEREFLIRRLERSESNNANALGRIQTSMERMGSAVSSQPAAPAPNAQAELIRIDGERSVSHTLSRRTRIGRAPTCELQIQSSSVSRHHALIVLGPREAVIEDLNSTNGVIVNSRKVSRHVLSEGDVITLGEIVFKFAAKYENTVIDVPAVEAPAI